MYLSRIEGSPPKRNAAGSIPVMDASKQRCKPLFSRVYSFFVITDREANVWLLMSVGISKSHLFCKIAC